MAVITIDTDDLHTLLGTDVSEKRLESDGSMLGILFEPNEDGTIDVEVEPNRPDLLSVEGVARALRGFLDISPGFVEYPVEAGEITVRVDKAVEEVRPHIACARVTDIDLDDDALDSLIQLQEKLTETYGRNRKKIAIGLHDLTPIEPPITYTAEAPDERAFVPLGREEEMTLAAIVEEHEKGKEYGWIVESAEKYPIIVDGADTVLSFPPVINGVATEVDTETDDLFLDVTGTSRDEVVTALHILVAALHERGGRIESVTVDGEARSSAGASGSTRSSGSVRGETMPDMSGETMTIDPDYVQKISGLDDLSPHGMAAALERMNYRATVDGDTLSVTVPAYRADIMHSYDIIEDIVISYGYDNVNPEIPDISTIGGLSREQVFTDRLREYMIGAGAQELMTFILSNEEKLVDRMGLDGAELVEMANPLTEDYAAVRHWLLPSLLDVLARNQHNRSPQEIFEVGRVATPDDEEHTGAADRPKLAYAVTDDDVGFSHARGILQQLATVLGTDLSVEEEHHPAFADKRCGTVKMDGAAVGIIGEVSEQVRANWEIDAPVTAFELDVTTLRELVDR